MKCNQSVDPFARALRTLAIVAAIAGAFGPGCEKTKLTVRPDGSIGWGGSGSPGESGGSIPDANKVGSGGAAGTIDASDSDGIDSGAGGSALVDVGGCDGTALNGVWIRALDGLTMILSADGCAISGPANNSGYLHTVTGPYDDVTRTLRGTIKRTTRSSGCTTIMTVTMVLTDATHFTLAITGTDGKCDLLTTYNEATVWAKQ
jgi:hypothetical protein